MDKLLASYLFQNRYCPLPGLGNLSVMSTAAITDFSNKKITAPAATIYFSAHEGIATDLVSYIAQKTNSNTYEATEAFDHYCDNLKNELTNNSSATLEGIGNLQVDAAGHISFEPVLMPVAFSPSVTAERVVHPAAEHSILVGDKETTNTVMTEYFNEVPVKKDRWWIWAIVLAALAIATIIIYVTDTAGSSLFGNAVSYELA